MGLTPEQRDLLRELLRTELDAAWRTAAARGTSPAALAGLLDERRRAVESSLAARDDLHHPGDDLIEGGAIGE